MIMKDAGHEATDKLLEAMEKRISKEYAQAVREAREKLRDYMKRFEAKDKLKKKALDKGLITKEEYEKWRVGQIAMGKRWEELRNELADDYHNANDIAKSIMKGYMPEVYAMNHNYGTYQVETSACVDTSYTLYDAQTVERLMRDNPQLLPDPGKDVSRRIANGLDVRWNRQQIQSVMMQSLLLGESIPDIAKRLAGKVGDSNHKAAIRNARTMTTGAENAGRVDSYKRAENMGIDLQQMWLATLDKRTRHSHRLLDGETVDPGEKFSNGLKFPGDPDGAPAEVWNCRCTLVAKVEDIDLDVSDLTSRNNKLGDMSYEEWRKGHSKPNPIDLPEKRARAIKQSYINDYKMYAKYGKMDSGDTISMINQRNTGKGNPNAILTYGVELNERQKKLLEKLPNTDDRVYVSKKDVNMKDLAALTAETGDEFALFTKGNTRMVMRGHSRGVRIDYEQAEVLAEEGYKWSGHTHPGLDTNVLQASQGDYTVLRAFKQKTSSIYNSKGQFCIFNEEQDYE